MTSTTQANIVLKYYVDVADIIWEYDMSLDWEAPLGAWRAAGGAGVWLRGASQKAIDQLQTNGAVLIWTGLD